MKILVTGGAGFIGSHTVIELQNAGHEPVILDNLYNASPKVIGRIEAITGKKVPFYEADIRDREALNRVFDAEKRTQSSISRASRQSANPCTSRGNTMTTISPVR